MTIGSTVSQETSDIDQHLTQILKRFESFKLAYLKEDYGACTEVLAQVNEILTDKTSKRVREMTKSLDDKEQKSEEKKDTQESEKDQKPEDFKDLVMDWKHLDEYPYGWIEPLKDYKRKKLPEEAKKDKLEED
ncbi:unnamed protein product [Microthlaspi erraticum]|uniref:Uncharacterized protein n=1 Tax=Microthlaspi erraticum TaxID=1685480 RepID=A0A6D2L441_9BRAS|nr:unnamed protein product [Microthlaspi erraticum]